MLQMAWLGYCIPILLILWVQTFELWSVDQDYMAHGTQGLFTQAGYNEPSQDDASQKHFGMPNSNSLQSQVLHC